nr:MAG TPA: hypothetical protein [Caudoviricetes sp.]
MGTLSSGNIDMLDDVGTGQPTTLLKPLFFTISILLFS